MKLTTQGQQNADKAVQLYCEGRNVEEIAAELEMPVDALQLLLVIADYWDQIGGQA